MFPIVRVETAAVTSDEQLGSKRKFWYSDGDERWLFKESRDGTGEDWAEKLAYEIAVRVAIPAAIVELADLNGRRGSSSRSFISSNTDLVHGNEILSGKIIGYDREKKLNQSDHTFDNIVSAIQKHVPEVAAATPLLQQLASYLVLDALVCNTDRHHENWGILVTSQSQPAPHQPASAQTQIAPSFDHASSLGRELRDERRLQILRSNQVENYIRRGRGGVYLRSTDPHGANPMRLVDVANRRFPDYFQPALRNVAQVPAEQLCELAESVPPERMSATACDFVKAVLQKTHTMLSSLVRQQ